MAAEHHDYAALVAVSGDDCIDYGSKVSGDQNIRKAADERPERTVVTRRSRELLCPDLVRTALDWHRADVREVRLGGPIRSRGG
jgi:hypothetical protein